ncbi:MAG: hypothetical protein SGILL_004861, partial [Bacillariaceae sp.]
KLTELRSKYNVAAPPRGGPHRGPAASPMTGVTPAASQAFSFGTATFTMPAASTPAQAPAPVAQAPTAASMPAASTPAPAAAPAPTPAPVAPTPAPAPAAQDLLGLVLQNPNLLASTSPEEVQRMVTMWTDRQATFDARMKAEKASSDETNALLKSQDDNIKLQDDNIKSQDAQIQVKQNTDAARVEAVIKDKEQSDKTLQQLYVMQVISNANANRPATMVSPPSLSDDLSGELSDDEDL